MSNQPKITTHTLELEHHTQTITETEYPNVIILDSHFKGTDDVGFTDEEYNKRFKERYETWRAEVMASIEAKGKRVEWQHIPEEPQVERGHSSRLGDF